MLDADFQRSADIDRLDEVEASLARLVLAHIALRHFQASRQLPLRELLFGSQLFEKLAKDIIRQRELGLKHVKTIHGLTCEPKFGSNGLMSIADNIKDDVMRRVLRDFRPRFAPNGRMVWVCEGKVELAHRAKNWLQRLRVSSGAVEELPNVVIRDVTRRRLWLIDVAALGRQMTGRRRDTLKQILSRSGAALLFVTAFENRKQMRRLVLADPWGTIAWFASEPDHLVHFDDDSDPRLLGRQNSAPGAG